MNKYIRIVGGQYRRTPISVINAPGLRPTPDRVRETLFNWLTFFWEGDFATKHVLDLFAGSGALGFEAASRGVASVQMVESHTQAVVALRHLRDKLNATQIRIHHGNAQETLLRTQASRFDLILLDPPFGENWFPEVLTKVAPLLNTAGLVYAETDSALEIPHSFDLLRSGRAGAVHYQLLQLKHTS